MELGLLSTGILCAADFSSRDFHVLTTPPGMKKGRIEPEWNGKEIVNFLEQ
jgi:hypothetical protein